MSTTIQLDPPASSNMEAARSAIPTDTLAVGIAVFAVLSILQRMIGFGRSVAFCHLMSVEELGRWSLGFSFLLTAAPLAVLGLPGSFGRYWEYYRQRGQVRGFLRKTLTLTAALAVAFILAVFTFAEVISHGLLGTAEHAAMIRSLAIVLSLVVALNVATELATAMRQPRAVSIVQFVHSSLFAIVSCILLTSTSLAEQGVIVGYGAASAIALAVVIWILRRRVKEITPDTESLDRSLWSRLLPFAAWMWVADALFNLFDTVDRLMIVHFAKSGVSTDALVGQYHSSRVIPILLVAMSAMLATVMLPYLSEDWERGKKKKASSTTLLAIKTCSLLFVSGGAVLLLVAPVLFDTLLRGKYVAGLHVLPFTLVYCIWFGLTVLAQNHLLCAERAKWTSIAPRVGIACERDSQRDAIALVWTNRRCHRNHDRERRCSLRNTPFCAVFRTRCRSAYMDDDLPADHPVVRMAVRDRSVIASRRCDMSVGSDL